MGTTGEGLLRPSRNCECLGATVRSPEHSLPDMPSLSPRGTECSRATDHGPKHSLLELTSLGSLGDSGARGSLFAAPSTLSRNLAFLVIGELGCSGFTVHGSEHPLLELGLLGSRGDNPQGRAPRGTLLFWPRDSGTPGSCVTDRLIKSIDKIRKWFIWSRAQDSEGSNLVNWEVMCRTKSLGGRCP